MFKIMKNVFCGKIIDYKLLQEKLLALEIENFRPQEKNSTTKWLSNREKIRM